MNASAIGGKGQQEALRVVVLDDWDEVARTSAALARLSKFADVLYLGACTDDDVASVAREAQVVIPMRERRVIDRLLLGRLPALRHIAQTGGSTSHIDLEAAAKAEVTVSCTRGASASSVAELALGLIIASRRGIVSGARNLHRGLWERPLGSTLSGTVLGIVGFGATGRQLASLGSGLGMDVLVHSRRGSAATEVLPTVGLDELCERSDVVSLHLELSEKTESIISSSHLRKIGPRGLLINTARAALVDRDDLLMALNEGDLGAAALDVFHSEPPAAGDRLLLSHPSVLSTPHLGWRTHDAMEAYFDGAVDNIQNWWRGQLTAKEDGENNA